MTVDEVMDQELGQAAFSAYVDAAQAEGSIHNRLVAGSYAAARGVIGRLLERGDIRPPLVWEAVHGTRAGYESGCRCEYCRGAEQIYERSVRHWNKEQGHNKVRA